MSTRTDDLETRLERELRGRADLLPPQVAPVAAIRRRARTGRVRRRFGAGAALAAAVAGGAAVPMALSGGPAAGPGPDEVPPTQTVTLDVDALTQGPTTATAFITPEGVQLGDATYDAVPVPQTAAPRGDGAIVLGIESGQSSVYVLDGEGRILSSEPVVSRMVVSQALDRVAYVAAEGTTQYLMSAQADGGAPVTWQLPAAPAVEPVGLGPDGVVFEEVSGGKAVPYLAAYGAPGDIDGAQVEPIPHLLSADAVDPATGRVLGTVPAPEGEGSCSGIVDPGTGELLRTACGERLIDFSPDGRHVLVGTPGAEGAGETALEVRDVGTWDLVLDVSVPAGDGAVLPQQVWEDAQGFLVTYRGDAGEALVRVSLDGSADLVDGPRPSHPSGEYAYWLG